VARKSKSRRLPWLLESYGPDDTARCLLLQTGSKESAHEAIARNADVLTRPKRDVPDAVLLDMAAAYQRTAGGRDNAALSEIARRRTRTADAAETVRRRLLRVLKGKTLGEFSAGRPRWIRPIL
jgi:hypothetical protein